MSPASRPPVPFSASPEGPPALAPCPGEAEEEATLRSRGGPGKVTSASLSTLRVPCWPVWQTFPPPPPHPVSPPPSELSLPSRGGSGAPTVKQAALRGSPPRLPAEVAGE